jgi:hypothetical protein
MRSLRVLAQCFEYSSRSSALQAPLLASTGGEEEAEEQGRVAELESPVVQQPAATPWPASRLQYETQAQISDELQRSVAPTTARRPDAPAAAWRARRRACSAWRAP